MLGLKVLVIVNQLLLFLFVFFSTTLALWTPVVLDLQEISAKLALNSVRPVKRVLPCSELEESYHSYHSTGYQPSRNGHHPTNGHASWGEDEGLKSSQENGKGISSTIKRKWFLKWI